MWKKHLFNIATMIVGTTIALSDGACKQLTDAIQAANDYDGGSPLTGGRKKAEPAGAKPSAKGEDGGGCAAAVPVMCSDGTCCEANTTCCGDGLCATDCTNKCPSDAPIDCLDGTCCPMKCCPNGGCDTCDSPEGAATSSDDGGNGGG